MNVEDFWFFKNARVGLPRNPATSSMYLLIYFGGPYMKPQNLNPLRHVHFWKLHWNEN